MKYNRLTNKEEMILSSLKKFIGENGYSPTVRELCKINNLNSSSTMQEHLNNLQEKGYINRCDAKSRTIEIISDKNNKKVIKVPFYKMGYDFDLNSKPSGNIDILSSLVNNKYDYFVLRVKGSDMKLSGIFDNDLVIVERCDKFLDGSVVVALYNNEIVIRYYNKCDNFIKLTSGDESVSPIVIDNVVIFGKVIGVYHSFR